MLRKGADIVIEALKEEGVEVLFGHPGGAIMEVYDALYRDGGIRHILARHEQGAGHMAEGYAKATGKVGVAMSTSGPGATNLVTAIADAYMDSVPVVFITGQVPTHLIGNDAFQEVDIVGITRPITKHNFLVKRIEDLPLIIRQAFYIARTGRPGPVLVDIPKDITQKLSDVPIPSLEEVKESLPGYKPHTEGNIQQIKRAGKLIMEAKRPVLYVGGGAVQSEAQRELVELAELMKVPVTTTNMGKGAFPELHPLALHMLGMHGTYYANMAVYNCDLLIAVGARFDDRVTGKVEEFAPQAKIIHIDIDPASISKNIVVDVPIVGDVKIVLRKLIDEIRKEGAKIIFPEDRREWIEQIERWKKLKPLTYKNSTDIIKPQFVIEQIYEATKGEAIISTGVGQHQMWSAMFYKYSFPRQFINSGGLGTMGFGFPAGIGAKIGRPEKEVFVIDGDGSFMMTMQELITAVQYKVPVKVAIINNGYLGMVRQWQELFYERRYSEVDLSVQPDFVKLAQACGAVGFRAEKPSEVREIIEEALKVQDKPVIMDFHVDREENVLPMVPAGKSYKDMILEDGKKAVEAETMYLVG
ncbi:MAG: biosynthetic-type acetolactate synthase large subunit [Acidobacteria bacterium]|nr:MAG: biosynthetic-type acetolactate synthase large subunit [Acidobacteriota bacterium]